MERSSAPRWLHSSPLRTYLLCVVHDLVFGQSMYRAWMALLPGFTWIVPMFYEHRDAWLRVMKQTIAINASFFNTHRMVRQYVDHAYASEDGVTRA